MGSVCIRKTNVLQTSLNSYKHSVIDNEVYPNSNLIQYDDIFNQNNSINVNDQQLWTDKNSEDKKWHDDLIYS
ncbi:unnamed protein product [Adineta steineri]|uniref:Uncharacterized protein n=1 Tax=Adineta steineri TaxID=433720 RepID=A0A818WGX3_9BILA|nr:unnamed protein product [Adineta steineri]CAF3725733.1 unnamed protein product [Adineta steineri]